MRAMLLQATGLIKDDSAPLVAAEWPDPAPSAGEILIKVSACGVCHTELDEIEGRMPPARLPVIPGHQVIGRVEAMGEAADTFRIGDRVGVAWIYSACGHCEFCRRGEENLCDQFEATGRDRNGGYAERMTVPQAFAHAIPGTFTDAEAAPLLCAGAIGFRSLRLAILEDGQNLGLTGFGASGHLVLMLVRHQYPSSRVFVFARSEAEREFARQLGASGRATRQRAPEKLHAIIDTTPAWTPVVEASKTSSAAAGLSLTPSARRLGTSRHCLASIILATSGWKKRLRASPTSLALTCANSCGWPPKFRSSPRSRSIRWKRRTVP